MCRTLQSIRTPHSKRRYLGVVFIVERFKVFSPMPSFGVHRWLVDTVQQVLQRRRRDDLWHRLLLGNVDATATGTELHG